jgi:hypothetical protein
MLKLFMDIDGELFHQCLFIHNDQNLTEKEKISKLHQIAEINYSIIASKMDTGPYYDDNNNSL